MAAAIADRFGNFLTDQVGLQETREGSENAGGRHHTAMTSSQLRATMSLAQCW